MVKFVTFILALSLLVCVGIMLLVCIFFMPTSSHVLWSKTLEGQGEGWSIKQTDEDGFIIATSSNIVKTDGNGNIQWSKSLSSSGYAMNLTSDGGHYVGESIYAMDLTSDGGYIVGGSIIRSSGLDGFFDWIYLAKTDSNGNLQWQKMPSENIRGSNVQQTSDGGYIFTGEIFSFSNSYDAIIVKTDANGEPEWNVTFGGTESEYVYYGIETVDGGYIITGETLSFGTNGCSDIFLIKIDNSGVIQWNKTYGGTSYDSALCVQQTDDGGFIITGSIDPYNGKSYVRLIKTDGNGTLQWDKYYAGTRNALGNYVQQTTEGGYLIVGIDGMLSDSVGELFLIKTDNMGNKQWTERLSGKGWAGGNSIESTKDGNYIVVGYTTLNPNTSWTSLYLVKVVANA